MYLINIYHNIFIIIIIMPVLKQKDGEEDIFVNNINYVGIFDMGDEEFTIGKENTVEVPGTGDNLDISCIYS